MAEQKKVTTPVSKKKANSNDGFAQVSRTVITTLQNSKGVKRVIKETTTAPKAKKQTTANAPVSQKDSAKTTTKSKGAKL